MQISQAFSWPAANWPLGSAATQYAIFKIYPVPTPGTDGLVQTVTNTTTVSLTYDDTENLAYQVRPTDGVSTYGPEISTFVIGVVPSRAWIRQNIRTSLADRANQVGVTINWDDNEINTYINEALHELSVLFPHDASTTITLLGPTSQGGVRDYALPDDFYLMRSVEYVTGDDQFHLFLKEKPFRGGETTVTSYIGYAKLGIMLTPQSGRFYVGHYDIYEKQIHLDWAPDGDGDLLHIRYAARYPLITTDAQLLIVQPEDVELLSLRAQMKCWLRVEGADVRLSRWRSKEDGGRRDDLPTQKMSTMIKQLYDQIVHDRREMRVRVRRLVRN